MTPQTTQFERKHVDALREMRAAARRAAAFVVPELSSAERPLWVRGAIDAEAMVNAFGFEVDAAWRLDSFVRSDDIGCEGRIVVVPAASEARSSPSEPKVSWGRAIAMGSGPWAYLRLSILLRELTEAGGRGAYRKWGKHDLLRSNPWDRLSVDRKRQAERFVTETQYWFLRTPDDVRPRVSMPLVDGPRDEAAHVVVRFHSVRRKRHMPVYEHRDVYAAAQPSDGAHFEVTTLGRELIGRVPVDRTQDWPGDVEDPQL